jgi:hypothetical protein
MRSNFSSESQKKVRFVLFDREKVGLSTGILKIKSVMKILKVTLPKISISIRPKGLRGGVEGRGIDAPKISLSNSENRRSLPYSYQKLFNLQPGLFYFETDSR